jgi:hypothetical protein
MFKILGRKNMKFLTLSTVCVGLLAFVIVTRAAPQL